MLFTGDPKMAPESLEAKIEQLIKDILSGVESMPEDELITHVVRKFGNGNIDRAVKNVITIMEQGKYTLARTLQGDLELSLRKR